MRKNPGRMHRRKLQQNNRTEMSEKKSAINERNMMWLLQRKHQFAKYTGTFLAGFNRG